MLPASSKYAAIAMASRLPNVYYQKYVYQKYPIDDGKHSLTSFRLYHEDLSMLAFHSLHGISKGQKDLKNLGREKRKRHQNSAWDLASHDTCSGSPEIIQLVAWSPTWSLYIIQRDRTEPIDLEILYKFRAQCLTYFPNQRLGQFWVIF